MELQSMLERCKELLENKQKDLQHKKDIEASLEEKLRDLQLKNQSL